MFDCHLDDGAGDEKRAYVVEIGNDHLRFVQGKKAKTVRSYRDTKRTDRRQSKPSCRVSCGHIVSQDRSYIILAAQQQALNLASLQVGQGMLFNELRYFCGD